MKLLRNKFRNRGRIALSFYYACINDEQPMQFVSHSDMLSYIEKYNRDFNKVLKLSTYRVDIYELSSNVESKK